MNPKEPKKNANAQRQEKVNFLIAVGKKILTVIGVIVLLRSCYTSLQQHRDQYGYEQQEIAFGEGNQSTGKPPQPESPKHFKSVSISEEATSPSDTAEDDTDNTLSQTSEESSTPQSKGTSKGLGALKGKNQWAIVYFPYTPLSTCKTALTIRSDVADIRSRGFSTLRLHASDCNALHTVGTAAHLHSMRLILGIHIDDSDSDDPLRLAEEQITDLLEWAADSTTPGWELIELVVIGEETIFTSVLEPYVLTAFMRSARTRLREAGYRGPVTTIEPIPTLYEHASSLCPVIDVPASNIHPFFSAAISAPNAGAYVKDALDVLDQICDEPKAPAVNLETGWPSRGRRNGDAIPGEVEQTQAITAIVKEAGARSTIIGWGDDVWRDPGELGVETAWGCENLFDNGGFAGFTDDGEVLKGEEKGYVERDT